MWKRLLRKELRANDLLFAIALSFFLVVVVGFVFILLIGGLIMWRPPKWRGFEIAKTIKANPYQADVELVEAGADAMLEAVKAEGEYGELHQARFMDLMSKHGWYLGNLPTGWLVFIEEVK